MLSHLPSFIFLLLLRICIAAASSSASNINNDAPPPSIQARTTNLKTRRRQQANNNDSDGNAMEEQESLGVTVAGVVYYDINQNGQRDPTESGVPNVTVQIRSCSNVRMGSTRTNSIGEYSVSLASGGCYFARLDVTAYQFTAGSDVNPFTGKTQEVELDDGAGHFWYAGIIPDVSMGITASPTLDPTPFVSASPTVSPATEPPTESPVLPYVTPEPTTSGAPTASPTVSSAPTECMVHDRVGTNVMSSSPIMRASFGMIFSLSTPELSDDNMVSLDGEALNATEYIRVTSLSMRVLTPMLNLAAATNYQVYYREGDYMGTKDEDGNAFDMRGDLSNWNLVADGNSIGSSTTSIGQNSGNSIETNNSTESIPNQNQGREDGFQEPLIVDSIFSSGASPSDENLYETSESNPLQDGGMETLNSQDSAIKSYLYRVPTSIFTPVLIPKYGGKVSFYVTLDRALLQYGDALESDWDKVDVENGEYDMYEERDMNLRIHVGEGVTSYPWTDLINFYTPRRFIGKVWYEQVFRVPCGMHLGAPSMSPSGLVIPPLPGESAASEFGAVGEAIDTNFVVSIFLQQDINDAERMNGAVTRAYRKTMLDFLNEEYIFEHCIWGISLDVSYQKLSLLEGMSGRRHLRGVQKQSNGLFGRLFSSRRVQTEITILQVEMLIKGVAYDHPEVCPNRSNPAKPTSRGKDWEETFAQLGIDYVNDNPDLLGEKLKDAHAYFRDTFAVAADPEILKRPEDETTITNTTTSTEESSLPLIPIIAGIVAAVLLLCLICCCCVYRKKKRQKEEVNENDELPKDIVILSDTDNDDSGTKEDPEQALGERGNGVEVDEDGLPTDGDADTLPLESEDMIVKAWPTLRAVPQLEDIVMMRGLPRRRSEPAMVTLTSAPSSALRRSRSISCLREVWVNLNNPGAYGDEHLTGGLHEQLINGTLYPIDDPDILAFERERYLMGDDAEHPNPFVPHGGGRANEFNFIDEEEAIRIEHPPVEQEPEPVEEKEKAVEIKAPVKVNPLVMQQVEMLEAKWKQLKDEYGSDEDSDDDDNLDQFDVNDRIEQLMTHIEKLELERKLKLAELKRNEEEEEELARKRMVRGGQGINYNDEFNKEFVIRNKKKKKKKKKAKKIIEEEEWSESEESEEEGEDGEFDVKWMRLKVPLADTNPESMRNMVEKGRGLDDGE